MVFAYTSVIVISIIASILMANWLFFDNRGRHNIVKAEAKPSELKILQSYNPNMPVFLSMPRVPVITKNKVVYSDKARLIELANKLGLKVTEQNTVKEIIELATKREFEF